METRKRRSWLAFALALCLAITMIPQNVWHVQAAGADNLNVSKIWATVNNEGMPENMEFSDTQPAGKVLAAIYVENGTYTVTDEQNVAFVLNNAVVVDPIATLNGSTNTAILAGDSSYSTLDWTVSSTRDRFPAYEGGKDIEALMTFFNTGAYAEDPENDIWPENYDYFLKQDYTAEGIINAHKMSIAQGATLTLGSFLEEGETRKAGSLLQATELAVSGTLTMLEAEDAEKPAGVTIFSEGSFEVTDGGKVNGCDGAVILLFHNANLSGLDLYEEDLENGQVVLQPFTFVSHNEEFEVRYDSDAEKWVVVNRGGNGADDKKLRVEYDMHNWGENDDRAFVTVNGQKLNDQEEIDFTVGQEFTVVLDPPIEREACTPIVSVETGDGKYYASNEEGEHALTITNNTFTFKATSEAGIVIRVNWSDYDMFWPTRNEFMIQADGYDATITVVGENVKSMKDPYDERSVKYIVQRDMFKDGKTVTLTFTADEGFYFDRISFWDGEDNTNYVTGVPREAADTPILGEGTGFTGKGGVYTYTFTEAPQAESVSFFTLCNPNDRVQGIRINPEDYRVEYCLGDDTQFTALNESRTIGYDVYSNTDKITLKVTALSEERPVMGIRVGYSADGKYRQEYLPLEDGKFTLVKNGQYWPDDYEIEILDWEPAFRGEYKINAYLREDDELELIDKEFDKKYTFVPGEKISFTLKGEVYKVFAEYNFINDPEIIPVNNVYSFTPADDRGFQFTIYPSKECYDYFHMNDDGNKGEMFGELCVNGDDGGLIGGTVKMNIEPTYQVVWKNQTKYATDGTKDLQFTIIPKRCSDYLVFMEDVDVTAAVKANNNVLNVETRNEYDYKRVEVFFAEGTSVPVTEVFEDIPENAWFKKAVQFVYDREIMNGKGKSANGDGQVFGPNQKITRGEFATLLYNREKKPAVELEAIFEDVKATAYYANPIQWLYNNKIAKGYGVGNKFGPNDPITREQLAKMLYEYAKLKGYDVTVADGVTLDRFADANKVSSYAITALKWATSNGIINGTGDEIPKLNPKGETTRAECAAMIKNLEEKVVNPSGE